MIRPLYTILHAKVETTTLRCYCLSSDRLCIDTSGGNCVQQILSKSRLTRLAETDFKCECHSSVHALACCDYVLLVAQVGPHICLFKTHVDIFDHWDTSVAEKLRQLADKHGELCTLCWKQSTFQFGTGRSHSAENEHSIC